MVKIFDPRRSPVTYDVKKDRHAAPPNLSLAAGRCAQKPSRQKPGHIGRVLAAIPRKFDVRRQVRVRVDKRGRELRAFERRKAAKQVSQGRLRRLRLQGGVAVAPIINSLVRCNFKRRCGSLACPMCARLRRIEHGASVLAFLASYPITDLRLLTLINPADAIPAGQLHTFDPIKLVNRTRRQLERAGISKTNCFMISAVDGEWDEGSAIYQPHLHLITYGITKDVLSRLIKSWPHDPLRVRVRKRLEPIDDLPRVVAYLDKTFWPSVARKNNKMGVYPHGKRQPPAPIEREVLLWLHRKIPSDLRFFFGVKLYRRRIMKTYSVHTTFGK